MVILISSLTLTNSNPLSAQLMVIYLINSSKHYAYNSSLMGQIPVSLAYLCYNLLSNYSCSINTSYLVAGVGETL